MACFFGIPFEAISSFTNCALISVSYLVVLGTFCTCVSALCAPSGILRPIACEPVLHWTMIDACLQIRLDIMQELRWSPSTSIWRQALRTEGPIRLLARLTWIHTLDLWIQHIFQLIYAIDHILIIKGRDRIGLLIVMNTLIVLWILNLEEELDNSNERLWKRRESTAIYYLMLHDGADRCYLFAVDLDIASVTWLLITLRVKGRNGAGNSDQDCCFTVEWVVGAEGQVYRGLLTGNVAR